MGYSAIMGGSNVYVNGYVAQDITAGERPTFLFSVIARGTQAFGEYPLMAVRIDRASSGSLPGGN